MLKIFTRFMTFINKPEAIIRQMPMSHEVSAFGDKYRDHLLTLPKLEHFNKIKQHSIFPYSIFKRFPKEAMEKVIDESFQIIKEKVDPQLRTIVYNMFMSNYLNQHIEFDIKALLKEMNDKGIPFNEGTYEIMIEFFSEIGTIEIVEYLVTTLTSRGIRIKKPMKISVITCYIISGQLDKMNQFMKDNSLNTNDFEVLVGQGQGYARIGDTNKLISVMNAMKDNGYKDGEYNMQFYLRLAASKESRSKVEEFSKLFLKSDERVKIKSLICFLNRNGLYKKSLKYVEKYHDIIKDPLSTYDILTSFNSKYCPVYVYKYVLKLYVNKLTSLNRNLFKNMDFDDAIQIARNIYNDNSGYCITISLQDKAISDKSVQNLRKALEFTTNFLKAAHLNSQLLFEFIPNILQSGMVTDSKALLELLPEYKKIIFPSVLMHHLSNAEFAECNDLISGFPISRKLSYTFIGFQMGKKMLQKLSFKELDNFAVEASKMFHKTVVANILTNYICNVIINNVETHNIVDTNEISHLVEKFRLDFRMDDIKYLKKKCSDYAEFIDSLPILTESPRMDPEQSMSDEGRLNHVVDKGN